jgi:ribosomal protein S3
MILLLLYKITNGFLLNGLCIQISGKFGGISRAIKRKYFFGKKIAVQTKQFNILYNFNKAITFTGVFGVHI